MQSALRGVMRSRFMANSLRQQCPRILHPYSLHTRFAHTIRYTSDHELIKFDDETGIGTVNLTDHAQSALGDVVFVELPSVGSKVTKGEAIGAVESVKAASDVYAPISGIVEEINKALSDQPGLLNKSAEDKGWLCKIRLSDPSEVETLMTSEQYSAFISD